MLIETLSTFPHMYDSVMGASMMKRALDKDIIEFHAYDLRDWTHDRHRTTDDAPYGGGPGLVMKCEPIFEAVDDIVGGVVGTTTDGDTAVDIDAKVEDSVNTQARAGVKVDDIANVAALPKPHIIFLSPEGQRFTDEVACQLAEKERLLFICGHYEGIDARAYTLADTTISLGDYVLTSGELASMVIIDAVVRKLPGVLGAAEEGVADESFATGLLEYPQYTRPENFRGMSVPQVLLSGDHAAVARYRREQALARTYRLRPDLLDCAQLSQDDLDFLKSLFDVS